MSSYCRILFIFLRTKPRRIIIQISKFSLSSSQPTTDKGESACIVTYKALCTQSCNTPIKIIFILTNNNIIIPRKQAPSFRANSTMIRLYQIRTAFGIATARQLHHLGPLVKSAIYITSCSIVVIAIALYFRVIILIIFTKDHFTDVQVFGHDRH